MKRSGFSVMLKLIGLVKPLLHIMLLAITLGTIGYCCATFITIRATQLLLHPDLITSKALWLLLLMAVSRGLLHYVEQYCNHFIAFKLLALIRHHVFVALQKLCPAKLEGKDKGNLISILTSDIELLEVFYAHTISPICIAIVFTIIMLIFIGQQSMAGAFVALIAYATVGIFIPLINGKITSDTGLQFRNEFGNLNSFILDSLRGLNETIQYKDGENQLNKIEEKSKALSNVQHKLSKANGWQRACTNAAIMIFSLIMFVYTKDILCTVTMMGSFGPVVALSNLSNNLNQTLASGNRVLNLLEEKPVVEEIAGSKDLEFNGANLENVTFSYNKEEILRDFNLEINKGEILGIHGQSGSGKSTLLKLLMRFWDVNKGKVSISQNRIDSIPTCTLRDLESYVQQDTYIFHDSIKKNIAIAKKDATDEEIIEACKKASIHDFIISLPDGYDTLAGELGDTLSGGEKQRIGLARAFLHNAPFILLDEPTSNLDSLNEGIILKSIKEDHSNKTYVLVSHRDSTMKIADQIFEMKSTRAS